MREPLVDAITAALFIKQNKDIGPGDIQEMADYTAKTLKESFTTYRIAEICQAIEIGARGELYKENDMNVVSPENIFKWIHRYNELIRRVAVAKQKVHDEKMEKQKELLQREERIKEFEVDILELYNSFSKETTNENYGVWAAIYRHLDKKEIITLSIQKKKDIFKEAEELKLKDIELAAEMGITPLLEVTTKEIAEAMALKEVFKQWKEIEFNLGEWL